MILDKFKQMIGPNKDLATNGSNWRNMATWKCAPEVDSVGIQHPLGYSTKSCDLLELNPFTHPSGYYGPFAVALWRYGIHPREDPLANCQPLDYSIWNLAIIHSRAAIRDLNIGSVYFFRIPESC